MLAPCAEVAVAEGVEVTTHEVYLEARAEKQQIGKVDPAGTASRSGDSMVDMNHHQTINVLSPLPHCLACGREAKADLKHCIPDLLVFTSTVINQPLDLRVMLSLTNAEPMVAIIESAESPVGVSQLLVPLLHSERRALNKHHDV